MKQLEKINLGQISLRQTKMRLNFERLSVTLGLNCQVQLFLGMTYVKINAKEL